MTESTHGDCRLPVLDFVGGGQHHPRLARHRAGLTTSGLGLCSARMVVGPTRPRSARRGRARAGRHLRLGDVKRAGALDDRRQSTSRVVIDRTVAHGPRRTGESGRPAVGDSPELPGRPPGQTRLGLTSTKSTSASSATPQGSLIFTRPRALTPSATQRAGTIWRAARRRRLHDVGCNRWRCEALGWSGADSA